MPTGAPISLVVAAIVAVIGGFLGAFIVIRYALEIRQRRQLAAQCVDVSAFDRDIRRYLERVWLLVAVWKPRLSAPVALDLDQLWEEALERGTALQASRADDAEVASDVAELVALEKRIEQRIEDARAIQ